MSISLGLVGLGTFDSTFADLFKSHPLVSRIALCDRELERIVLGASSSITPGVPWENISALVEGLNYYRNHGRN
jgi:hypothetical protein